MSALEAKTIESINPANGDNLGSVAMASAKEVQATVSRAKQASVLWKKTSFDYRQKVILKARSLILEEMEAIANLISQENGKPVMEALSHDIMPVLDLMTYFAKNTKKLLKRQSIAIGKWEFLGHQSYAEFDPYGVVGVISPWNFPFSIPLGEVTMALMAGNTVVLKPSEYTPLIGIKIGEIFAQAGLDENVLQILSGDGLTGKALVLSDIDKISFTGSVATGKKIMAEAAKNLTPVKLELGGKDPFIVLPDANLDRASSAAVWGAFCNSGQVCASVERVYVHHSIAKPFEDLVVQKTQNLRQGLPNSPDVDIGAMTASMQLEKVKKQVDAAIEKGAQVLVGGQVEAKLGGQFFQPTVLSHVDESFDIVKDETFGPVLPLMTYQNEEELIGRVNDSEYGLNAYIWCGDISKAHKLAAQIEAGTININESVFSHAVAQTPWGGIKASGIGRTHSKYGLMDLVRVRHVYTNRLSYKFIHFWWFGYSQEKIRLIQSFSWMLFGSVTKKIKALFDFVKDFFKAKTI